jgi:hypothetical protein
MLMVPQRAYVPVGTLRRAVTYPQPAEAKEADEVARALTLVGLAHPVDHFGEAAPWDQMLSGGDTGCPLGALSEFSTLDLPAMHRLDGRAIRCVHTLSC